MSRRGALPSPNFTGKGKRRRKGGGAPPAAANPPARSLWTHLFALLAGAAAVAWLDRTVLRPAPPAGGGMTGAATVTAPRSPATADPSAGDGALLSPPPAVKLSPGDKHAPSPLTPYRSVARGGPRPRLAIVMDDAGERVEPVRELAAIDAPLTLAVIPYLPASRDAAELWHAQGRDVILHLPMEAQDSAAHSAGRGAIVSGMDPAALRATVDGDLAAVPHIVGVNNHMGSRATSDGPLMDRFMEALKPSGLWFLDSRTAGSSLAYETARRHGVRATYRSALFLDDERTAPAIRAALYTAVAQARARGSAVTIGHVTSPETIRVLREELPRLRRDCDVVSAASLLE